MRVLNVKDQLEGARPVILARRRGKDACCSRCRSPTTRRLDWSDTDPRNGDGGVGLAEAGQPPKSKPLLCRVNKLPARAEGFDVNIQDPPCSGETFGPQKTQNLISDPSS